MKESKSRDWANQKSISEEKESLEEPADWAEEMEKAQKKDDV